MFVVKLRNIKEHRRYIVPFILNKYKKLEYWKYPNTLLGRNGSN